VLLVRGFVYGWSEDGLQVRRDFETLVCGGLRIEEVRLEESGFGKGRSSKLTEKARYWGANFSARSDAPDVGALLSKTIWLAPACNLGRRKGGLLVTAWCRWDESLWIFVCTMRRISVCWTYCTGWSGRMENSCCCVSFREEGTAEYLYHVTDSNPWDHNHWASLLFGERRKHIGAPIPPFARLSLQG